MLNVWMYQASRDFSHSGMCCTTPISATSSGGSRSAAAIRKTIEVWYEWSRIVVTPKSCAIPAHAARMRKVGQPCVWMPSLAIGGIAANAVAAATTAKYAFALGESEAAGGEVSVAVPPRASSPGTALIYPSPSPSLAALFALE